MLRRLKKWCDNQCGLNLALENNNDDRMSMLRVTFVDFHGCISFAMLSFFFLFLLSHFLSLPWILQIVSSLSNPQNHPKCLRSVALRTAAITSGRMRGRMNAFSSSNQLQWVAHSATLMVSLYFFTIFTAQS
jgi:hypothetical protein